MSVNSELIREQARYWVVEVNSGDVTAEQISAFDAWYGCSEEHARVYHQVESLFFNISELSAADFGLSGNENQEMRGFLVGLARFFGPLRNGATSAWAASMALLVIAVVLIFTAPFDGEVITAQQYSTNTAEQRDIELEDGSIVTLGADTLLSVEMSDQNRKLVLNRGQVFFDVANDSQRPFFVQVANVEVRVLGTRFDIHKGVAGVHVGVEQGRVAVTSLDSSSGIAPVALSASQGVMVSANSGVGDVQQLDDIGQWRNGRLVYVDSTLAEIVADINRYHPSNVVLASQNAADLRLTTVFRTDQIDKALDVLELALPVKVTRGKQNTIYITYTSPR